MLPPVSGLLRRHGVPVPHWHLPTGLYVVAGVLVIAFVIMFVVVELNLLSKATATVDKPELHERYKALMLHWPYALLSPYTIFKTHVLPRVFFGPDDRRGPDSPTTGSHRAGRPTAARPNPAKEVETVALADEPAAGTRDEYRTALALVINQIDSMTTDRELRDLLLEKYRSLEASGDIPAVTDVPAPPRPRARSSNRWTDPSSDERGKS
jgi:hypothetical protein